jgi:hypothetical protein
MRLLLVVALAGCAPVVDLPEPRAPTDLYLPPTVSWSAPGPPLPDTDGPCLQETSRRYGKSSHHWLWKRGVEQGSLSAATADDPAAHAIALRADRLARTGMAFVLLGMPTMMSGYFSSVSTLASQSPVTLEVGLPVLATGLALIVSGAVMESRARPIRKAAIAEYNARCR